MIDGQFYNWWIANAKVFGTYVDTFVTWRYPQGGEPVKTIDGPPSADFGGITVSNVLRKKSPRSKAN